MKINFHAFRILARKGVEVSLLPLAKDKFEALRERIGMCSFGKKKKSDPDLTSTRGCYQLVFIHIYVIVIVFFLCFDF
jgi:hypothetical protein